MNLKPVVFAKRIRDLQNISCSKSSNTAPVHPKTELPFDNFLSYSRNKESIL